MKRFLPFLGLSLVVALALLHTENAHAQRPPLVLSFYYTWFDENTWRADKVPDLPAEKYVSRDSNAMARHIRQARGAGIDAFVVSWWGTGNPTDDNFKTMLDLARGMDFKLAIDFELTSPFYRSKDDAIRSLRYLISTHTQHPAYLRSDGKPVIFFWRQQLYSVDEWKAIRDAVDPERRTIWILEGLDPTYLRVFDGLHLYMIAWAKNAQAELNKWPRRIQAYGDEKIWVATVNPGADNRKTTQSEKVVRDREGGEYYRETWRAAFSSSPDWIMITSWNEWPEGTMIEPSVTYGNLYLDITREYAAKFKAGLPPATPTPTKTSTPTRTPTATATFTPTLKTATPITTTFIVTGVRATISDTLPVRTAPSANAEILGYLRESQSVTLLGRTTDSRWWQIPYLNGALRGWISAGFVEPEDDLGLLPIIDANTPVIIATPTLMPTATATATAIPAQLLPDTPTRAPTSTPTASPVSLGFLLRSLFPFLP